jgi:hypothetical protein
MVIDSHDCNARASGGTVVMHAWKTEGFGWLLFGLSLCARCVVAIAIHPLLLLVAAAAAAAAARAACVSFGSLLNTLATNCLLLGFSLNGPRSIGVLLTFCMRSPHQPQLQVQCAAVLSVVDLVIRSSFSSSQKQKQKSRLAACTLRPYVPVCCVAPAVPVPLSHCPWPCALGIQCIALRMRMKIENANT